MLHLIFLSSILVLASAFPLNATYSSVPVQHWIFALDQSTSMLGAPWNSMVQSLSQILPKLAEDPARNVSIIKFSNYIELFAENVSPADLSLKKLKLVGGGTDITNAMLAAMGLIKDHQTLQTCLIFITDVQTYFHKEVLSIFDQLISSQGSKNRTMCFKVYFLQERSLRWEPLEHGLAELEQQEPPETFRVQDASQLLPESFTKLLARYS